MSDIETGFNYPSTFPEQLAHEGTDTIDYPAMPPVPTTEIAEAAKDAERQTGINRRAFLVRGGLATVGSLIAASRINGLVDPFIQQQEWPDDPRGLRLETLKYDKDPASRTEGCLTAAGFGGRNGTAIANFLQTHSSMSDVTPIASFVYPNQGYTQEDAGTLVADYIEAYDLESLSLIGVSMGGPTLLDATRRAADSRRAAGLPVVPLRRIILITSPENIGNARDGELGSLVAKLGLGKTTAEKYIGGFLDNVRYDGWKSLDPEHIKADFVRAWHSTMSGASGRLLGKQLQNLDDFDFISQWKSYKDLIVPGFTEVRFNAPDNPASDKTVDNRDALRDWEHFFGLLGVTVDYQGVKQPGHAQYQPSLLANGPWIKKTNPTVVR